MEMTLRWYGSKFDTVTLKQIRQIPGVTGVITTLYDTEPGEVWSRGRIRAMKDEVEAAGLHVAGIESVNIHDAIKTGAPEREQYIANYIETLENLGKEDIHMVCYNFMPVFDWTRTELARVRADGSTVLAYTQEAVDALDPEKMFESISGDMNGSIMPGWEPERMARVDALYMDYLCSHHAEIQYLYLIYTVYNVIILPFHSCKKEKSAFHSPLSYRLSHSFVILNSLATNVSKLFPQNGTKSGIAPNAIPIIIIRPHSLADSNANP